MTDVLVINAGSSSIKFAVFDAGLAPGLSGAATEIGGAAARLRVDGEDVPAELPDQPGALKAILGALEARGVGLDRLSAAAHRVVHGGTALTAPTRVTAEVEAGIEACGPLAPLHNPHNLAAIRTLGELAPELPQFATFDTGFHASNPELALRYAIPEAEDARGIRRYGFHGISYQSLVARLPEVSGSALPARVLALHLGNGASLCAIREGRSAATTMGYSPLDGLTMGTRSGEIDGNAVLRLADLHGIDGARRILNHESGLKALGGQSDMRALQQDGTEAAEFAVAHFCYWAVRHAGSMIAAMGGLDAVAFTGGIGENDARVRGAILQGLGWAGARLDPEGNAGNNSRLHPGGAEVAAWIVPADEERQIARDALKLLGEAG